VAFGYNPLAPQKDAVTGYPEIISASTGLPVTNASCPGEASGGFLSPEGSDNGCRQNRQKYPLHASYAGTQMQFALEFLRDHPNTQLVTIDIGGNDADMLKESCMGETSCILSGFVGLLTTYGKNVDSILGELRKVYDGPLVGLAIYNPFPGDTIAAYGLERLNSELAGKLARYDGIYADGMTAFTQASAGDPCGNGYLIKLPDGSCDIHPTPKGAQVLADTVQSVMGAVP
jgi:lysophospholipase L1-like esterase